MRLATIADYANVTENGKLNIMGIFAQISPPQLPYVLPTMYIVLQLVANLAEVGSTKEIKISLIDEDGAQLLEAVSNAVVPAPKLAKKGVSESQVVLSINNLRFDKPGDYEFCIVINGETKKTIELRVNQQEVTEEDVHSKD